VPYLFEHVVETVTGEYLSGIGTDRGNRGKYFVIYTRSGCQPFDILTHFLQALELLIVQLKGSVFEAKPFVFFPKKVHQLETGTDLARLEQQNEESDHEEYPDIQQRLDDSGMHLEGKRPIVTLGNEQDRVSTAFL
jgi:hypothetical protein